MQALGKVKSGGVYLLEQLPGAEETVVQEAVAVRLSDAMPVSREQVMESSSPICIYFCCRLFSFSLGGRLSGFFQKHAFAAEAYQEKQDDADQEKGACISWSRRQTGNALFTGDHGRWILIFCFMTRRLLTARRFIFPILIYRTEHLFLFL